MIKCLRKESVSIFYFGENGEKINGIHYRIWGDVSRIRGDVSGIEGDVFGIRGDVSGIRGDVSGIEGDIDKAELTGKERIAGVNIVDLIV